MNLRDRLPDTKNCVIAINAKLFLWIRAATSMSLHSTLTSRRHGKLFFSQRRIEDSRIKSKEKAA